MRSYAVIIAELEKLIEGLKANPPSAPLMIGGKRYTGPQACALIQSVIDAMRATMLARATYRTRVMESEDAIKSTNPFLRDLRQILQLTYSDDLVILSSFGLAPRKVGHRSVEVNLAAAEKARATRKARHTMGSKQKKAIKGNVGGVTITPITHGEEPPEPE